MRWLIEATAFAALIVILAWWIIGCAHGHLERWDPVTGMKVCEVESMVLGTGETEQVTSACGDFAYSTRDTGLSDNGKAALGEIAEGAVRGLKP